MDDQRGEGNSIVGVSGMVLEPEGGGDICYS